MIRHDVFNRHQIIGAGVRSHGFMPTGEDQYAISFNATTTNIACGSAASIDDLHDGAMTVEAWIYADGWGENNLSVIAGKRTASASSGWLFYIQNGNGLVASVKCATTAGYAKSGTVAFSPDSAWHHMAMTWDDASYNYPRLWIDGVEKTTTTTNRSGAIGTDAAGDMYLGARYDGNYTFNGDIAWIAIHDIAKWTSGFTPNAKDSPPSSDANTVALWKMNEGTGTSVADSSSNSNPGTLSNGSWVSL